MAEELVGHDVRHDGDDLIGAAPDGAEVRLLRLAPDGPSVFEALRAAAGEHVEAVLDVGTAVNGDVVLVLPRLPGRLEHLLRAGVTPGEAVTVLVPLVTTVLRLHAAGVAHGALGVGAVRFDDRGAAVLTRFERAVLRSADPAGFERARRDDEAALGVLAAAVLRVARVEALAAAVEAGRVPLAGLPDALFALAEPAPVRLQPSAPGLEPRVVSPPATPEAAMRQDASGPAPDVGTGGRLRGPARAVLAAVGASLRSVRPRAWIGAGLSLGLLAAALVLLPGRGASGVSEPASSSPIPASTARPSSAAAARPSRSPTATPIAVPSGAVAAGRVLLAERSRCVAIASAACLAAVDAAGSPVLAQDTAAVAAGVEAVVVPPGPFRLRSASGGTALLGVGDVTVLLIREQHGWRLRDVIGPPAVKPTARSTSGGGG